MVYGLNSMVHLVLKVYRPLQIPDGPGSIMVEL